MLIKDSSNPTPFFTRKPVPEVFKTEVERQRYWAKEKKRWLFTVHTITDDKIILLPQKGVKFPYEMELIPLPEP
jgi:hypothetical protein